MTDFATRYGAWAVVTGAAQGVGLAFAEALLARGCRVALVDRQPEVLEVAAPSGPGGPRGRGRPGRPGWLAAVAAATEGLEIGLAVANAAVSYVGPLPRPAGRQPGRRRSR